LVVQEESQRLVIAKQGRAGEGIAPTAFTMSSGLVEAAIGIHGGLGSIFTRGLQETMIKWLPL